MYDLLIYLLNNPINLIDSAQFQRDFLKAISILKIIILNLKTDITDQSEEENQKIFAKQENVLSNAEILLKKRNDLLEQFSKNNIISMGEKIYDAPTRSEESTSEKLERKSDQSIPKWVQVSENRFNFIKLKINKNKKIGTTIDKNNYTLNNAYELINKIAGKKLVKMMPLKITMIW